MDTDVKTELAVLGAKLDSVHALILEKLSNMENRIDRVEDDVYARLRHERGNQDMRFDLVQKELEDRVTKDQFTPIRLVVYGLCGLCLTGVGAAILQLIKLPIP
ncbi:hypothetical protein ACFODL_15615 [Phenylobacterium terrae]|uniref:DUF1640 domain-containing protein n=1 Tax=Phenylobacterium terrae TaxID=2665495 RepID=A0ABW4N722_9CAUL